MAGRYPAIWTLGAVVLGIIFSDTIAIESWLWFLAALIFVFAAVYLSMKKYFVMAGVFCLFVLMFLSAFGYSFRYNTFPPGHVVRYIDDDSRYSVYGTIDDWPVISQYRTVLYVAADSILDGEEIVKGHGRLLLNISTETTRLQYGDRIVFDARLFGIKGGQSLSGFDYRRYLNLRGVFAAAYLPHDFSIRVDPVSENNFYRLVDYVRREITGTFKRTLEPDAAAMASGFLIGETRDIQPHIYNLFRDSGTLHLLAVSGSNVALVVLVFVFMLQVSPMQLVKRSIILLAVILFFSFLAYNQPSVVRAAVMASMIIIGKAFQRRIDYNNIIAGAALLILLFKPTELFDVGFQLSFATAWGLIFFLPKLMPYFESVQKRWYYKVLIFPFLVCMVAQIVSLPMSAYYFQRVPLIAFVSNVIIVPMVGVTVIGEMVVLFSSLVLPVLGSFFGAFLNPLLNSILYLLEIFGSEEGAVLIRFRMPGVWLPVYYMVIIISVLAISTKRFRRILAFTVLSVLIIFIGYPTIAGKQKNRFTVSPVSGGIIAVHHENPEQVILCNLPLKDYSIAEKIVSPYLDNLGISNPDVLVLSSEYASVREAMYLHFIAGETGSKVYIPQSAGNMASDIAGLEFGNDISMRVVLYDNPPKQASRPGCGKIILSPGNLIYCLDSSMAVFISCDIPVEEVFPVISQYPGEVILIKPIFDNNDITYLAGNQSGKTISLVCNGVTPSALNFYRSIPAENRKLLPLIRLSRYGTMAVVSGAGRLSIRR